MSRDGQECVINCRNEPVKGVSEAFCVDHARIAKKMKRSDGSSDPVRTDIRGFLSDVGASNAEQAIRNAFYAQGGYKLVFLRLRMLLLHFRFLSDFPSGASVSVWVCACLRACEPVCA